MKTKFEIGDVVRMKSGGPGMTVSGVTPKGTPQPIIFDDADKCTKHTTYVCQWFSGSKPQVDTFIEEILVAVDGDKA